MREAHQLKRPLIRIRIRMQEYSDMISKLFPKFWLSKCARLGVQLAKRTTSPRVRFVILYHFHSYPINTATTKANDPTIPTLIMSGMMNRNQRS